MWIKENIFFSYALYPLLSIIESSHAGSSPKDFSFIKVHPENIILKVIKKAEDSESFILRLYETIGQKTQVEIHFSESPLEIWKTDMMEREISKLSTEEKLLKINFGAYEIKTLKVII